MAHAVQLSRLYAGFHRPVVFVGPVGVGKTTLARAAHDASGVRGAFLAVSSGELSETLFPDTLFGHEAGAYTGAHAARRGAIESAANGTLLLDDIALLPHAVQAAVLRVLDSGCFRRLGSVEDRRATCRFFFASTRPLDDLIDDGTLLHDFTSRIGELVVSVPRMADRREDILPLAREAAERFLSEHGSSGSVEFSEAAVDLLVAYSWPRNIREIRGVIERAVIHAGARADRIVIRPGHLPDRFHRMDADAESGSPQLSVSLIQSVLDETGGNQSEVARRLGVHRNTIARYLKGAG